jgi:hypothetical protein
MKSTIALSAAIGLGLSFSAVASELTPLQAGTFVVGNHIASVYYTEHRGRYEVVTTVASDPDLRGAPLRFVGSLAVGEKQTISFGAFGTTAAPNTLELVHDGDRLVATVVDGEVASR